MGKCSKKTTGEGKMAKHTDKKLVKGNKKHVRLRINKEQLIELGIITEDDGLNRYITVFKKDNRNMDNALHIVNKVFIEEILGE